MRANEELGRPVPFLIALALDEQMIDEVPLEAHDKYALLLLSSEVV
jgi:5-formyltetrahydrofolate cyclo-ligase